MPTKSSAHYQREHRKRLREQGLVKKEIWIRPEHANKARAFEKSLRNADIEQNELDNKSVPTWRTQALFNDLSESVLVQQGKASIDLIDGADSTIHLIMHDYGDLPEFLSVAGDQIIIESILWPKDDVNEIEKFNDAILRTHKYLPLSTICLEKRGDIDYYLMFGALSATSSLDNIRHEVEVLASNVIQATEAYKSYLQNN